MSQIEWKGVTPEQVIRDIEESARRYRENKYAFQTGLRDLDFDIDENLLKALTLSVPFRSIDQAEQALRGGAIHPIKFIEDDQTEHQVLNFDPRPVGFSGFMDCVTHSLALTDLGLFEVGRYPAVSLVIQNRSWQWFLHRRLATPEEFSQWCERQQLSSQQFMEKAYQAYVSV
jgi:hypothetical protein